MKRIIFTAFFVCIYLGYSEAASYKYSDYTKIRNEFDDYSTSINSEIEKINKKYIESLNSYQQCSSNKWRIIFIPIIEEIDLRRSALDEYKRNAYAKAGVQNSEMLEKATYHKINQVQSDQDITDFVMWYKMHISFLKSGPFHEIEVYMEGYKKLIEVYNEMTRSCAENSYENDNPEIVKAAIGRLLDGVLTLIGKIK